MMNTKHVHLIGIGGTGLSAIALVLLERGYRVSGSDRQASAMLERLKAAGAIVFTRHDPLNIRGAGLVVRSSAIPDDNPEVQAARDQGIPVFKRSDFLGELTAGQRTVAVAGTHGKTTTTAMIVWILVALGLDPSFIIGGLALNLGVNAHAGHGPHFVIEADEYDRMFLGLTPELAVITNIEHDHPDCYPTPLEFFQAFREFAGRLVQGGTLIVCGDDPGARALGSEKSGDTHVISYGMLSSHNTYSARFLQANPAGGVDFRATSTYKEISAESSRSDQKEIRVTLQIPGNHNILNALAALAVADLLGLPWDEAAAALAEYRGAGRRFEVRGEFAGIAVVDDYAHHPTEIKATLSAARARYPGRTIWAVWQPHTYSRTRLLAGEFAAAFGDRSYSPVEHVIVTEVYAARELPPADSFSSRQIVAQMDHPDAVYIADLPKVTNFLLATLHPGDVLLVLSAGDADQISNQVQQALGARSLLME